MNCSALQLPVVAGLHRDWLPLLSNWISKEVQVPVASHTSDYSLGVNLTSNMQDMCPRWLLAEDIEPPCMHQHKGVNVLLMQAVAG